MSLAKRVLIPAGSLATASATVLPIQKKIHSSGTTALLTSNEKNGIVTSLDYS